jgi:hypothetical protein
MLALLGEDEQQQVIKRELFGSPEDIKAPAKRTKFDEFMYGQAERVTIDYRNGIALRAFDTQQASERGCDVMLVWGNDHLPGLEAGLAGRGYVQTDEKRLVAVHGYQTAAA